MERRCPQCYRPLAEDDVWVCPNCGYTLRTPAVSKMGIVVMVLGVALLAALVIGPESLGLRSGWVPYPIADFIIANFTLLVVGTIVLGMFLVLAGVFKIRREGSAAPSRGNRPT